MPPTSDSFLKTRELFLTFKIFVTFRNSLKVVPALHCLEFLKIIYINQAQMRVWKDVGIIDLLIPWQAFISALLK